MWQNVTHLHEGGALVAVVVGSRVGPAALGVARWLRNEMARALGR